MVPSHEAPDPGLVRRMLATLVLVALVYVGAVLPVLLLAGVVWGGLLVILATAARSEGRKGREG